MLTAHAGVAGAAATTTGLLTATPRRSSPPPHAEGETSRRALAGSRTCSDQDRLRRSGVRAVVLMGNRSDSFAMEPVGGARSGLQYARTPSRISSGGAALHSGHPRLQDHAGAREADAHVVYSLAEAAESTRGSAP